MRTGSRRAISQARSILAAAEGCRSVRMTHGIESPQRFVLLVEWDSVEAHEAFRSSATVPGMACAIGPVLRAAARVEHFTDVG